MISTESATDSEKEAVSDVALARVSVRSRRDYERTMLLLCDMVTNKGDRIGDRIGQLQRSHEVEGHGIERTRRTTSTPRLEMPNQSSSSGIWWSSMCRP